MKHEPKATTMLILIFVLSQIMGLVIVTQYFDHETSLATGKDTYEDLPFVERPEINQTEAIISIVIAIIIGTMLILLLMKYKQNRLWKLWFFLSIVFCLTFAFFGFTKNILPLKAAQLLAVGIATVVAILKIYRPNFWVHNISEIFIYGGLAAIFAPMLNLKYGIVLLLIISAYDMYAVWHSKHMIKLAKGQSEQKLFAGLMVPYKKGKKSHIDTKAMKKISTKKKGKVVKGKTAILGGGDVGFPLIFAAIVMKTFIMKGIAPIIAYLQTSIVIITTTLALFMLFKYGEKNKFYPAMPFLSAGCFVGLGLAWLTLGLI